MDGAELLSFTDVERFLDELDFEQSDYMNGCAMLAKVSIDRSILFIMKDGEEVDDDNIYQEDRFLTRLS